MRDPNQTFELRTSHKQRSSVNMSRRYTISRTISLEVQRSVTKYSVKGGSRDTKLCSLNPSELLSESYESNEVQQSTLNHNDIIEKY
jgi:hypothetical protein